LGPAGAICYRRFGRGRGLYGCVGSDSRVRALIARSLLLALRRDSAQIYVAKGFNKEEAAAVIGTLTRKREYHDYFVDHMMVQARCDRQIDRQHWERCALL